MNNSDQIRSRLDALGDLTSMSIEDLFLGLCAIQERQKTVNEYRTTHTSSGSGRKVERLNTEIRQYIETEGIYTTTGRDFAPTKAGRLYRERVPDILEAFIDVFEHIKTVRSRSVIIAATQFMTELVFEAYRHLLSIFEGPASGTIEHKLIRSSELEDVLQNRSADLAFGACLSDEVGEPDISSSIQVNEILRENVGVLSNFDIGDTIHTDSHLVDIINNKSLLLPDGGIVRGFVEAIIRDSDNIYAPDISEITDIWIGLAKLEHGIHGHACMFLLEGVLNYNERVSRLIERGELYFNIIPPELYVKSIIVGLFRHEDHANLPSDHPFKRIWRIDADKFLPNN